MLIALILFGLLAFVIYLALRVAGQSAHGDNRSSTTGDNSSGYIPGVTDSGGHKHHHFPGCGHGHDGGGSDSGGGDSGGGGDGGGGGGGGSD